MIRGLLLAATAAASLCALNTPAAADERLVHHMFSENEVVRIDGRTGVQATISFGEGEAIENVAVGDSAAWQITPNKRADLLFVKPLDNSARTNMTVVTDRHTYFFDLVASPRTKPVYLLRFTYKDEPKKKPSEGAALAALTADEQAVLGGGPAETPVDPAALNFAWRPKGDTKILPARIYDDGNATYLLWGEKSEVPAILVLNEKGEEGPVNYSVRGRTIVVDDVPRAILLRSGKAQATLENQRPSAAAPAIMNAGASTPSGKVAQASVAAAALSHSALQEH
ncbi:TrbG/VirB9 family P-type conjugative transfer protein [Novosphingobium sp. M1R2S20]|uniref:TrbG/VirB9 family P-type conjugative transfer protein n=1 Tax=Novosphingobium rhizovicinum TaxID=3228928 RepID=A0ABV3RDC9_9SPHN